MNMEHNLLDRNTFCENYIEDQQGNGARIMSLVKIFEFGKLKQLPKDWSSTNSFNEELEFTTEVDRFSV